MTQDPAQLLCQTWLIGRQLIGAAPKQRLRDGLPIRFAEGVPIKDLSQSRDRFFTYQIRDHYRPHEVALFGRLEPDGEWVMVDGPWLAGMALPADPPKS